MGYSRVSQLSATAGSITVEVRRQISRAIQPCVLTLVVPHYSERNSSAGIIAAARVPWLDAKIDTKKADDTPREQTGAKTVRSPIVSFYRILPGKTAGEGRQVLNGYRGTAVADGFAVYDVLARDGPNFTLAHCWSHAKRKYEEIAEHWPVACAEIGALIGELYAIERLAPGPFPGDAAAQVFRRQLRHERSRPLLDQIWQWATVQVGLPRSDFGKAVRYMLERWGGLTRFVDDPGVPLDNNAAERALRGPVVGRKNHCGWRSLRGTQVAALFYTLCETAKLVGVDPHAYLLRAVYAAIVRPGTIPTLRTS